jgi:hypothetical protein
VTTARKVSANRENAQKSTGPKSAAGKRRSATNAIRHGLRSRPDVEHVRAWYRIILNDSGAQIDEIHLGSRSAAALNLAEAEVRLANVRREEERHLVERAGAAIELDYARVLRRYRREAEVHRARALEHWIENIG